ncbi:hypothetical protein [Rhizorhabdus sp.]|uniref:hypothetical protein n=1 Tax=Rhizorhabdus sp. TaxID=1968843 RepID=UPI0019B701D2|nr:hypothetical protein [Rhizorhabdus sp.]MBD3762595.1 hypothetical protein [Rhizorhabdus sp.]
MISKETATDIALARREVETATKLLEDVRMALDKYQPEDLRDAFGRRQTGLQLGVPSGQNGHRLYDVPYGLAVPVIEAHIAHHRACIAALSLKAAAELAGGQKAPEEEA